MNIRTKNEANVIVPMPQLPPPCYTYCNTPHMSKAHRKADENIFYPLKRACFYRNKVWSTAGDSEEALGKAGKTRKRSCKCNWKTLPFSYQGYCYVQIYYYVLFKNETQRSASSRARYACVHGPILYTLGKAEIWHEDHPFGKAWFLAMLTILSWADFAQCMPSQTLGALILLKHQQRFPKRRPRGGTCWWDRLWRVKNLLGHTTHGARWRYWVQNNTLWRGAHTKTVNCLRHRGTVRIKTGEERWTVTCGPQEIRL